MLDEDVFDSVTWETPTANGYDVETPTAPSGPGYRQSTAGESGGPNEPKWEGYLITSVRDPLKELADTKDAYVSYLVTAEVGYLIEKCGKAHNVQTNLPTFSSPMCSSRRRFQDFVFLRDNISKDFPACVVPPLPDKHRLGVTCSDVYWIATEYLNYRIPHRRPIQSRIHGAETSGVSIWSSYISFVLLTWSRLSRFLERLSRHPTLQRATLVRSFFESKEWVIMSNYCY